jgi:HTH-type transcriptional regulator, competence development regulator
MNNLTPFGKLLRMLRLDKRQTLKDMTEHLMAAASHSISPAFLSAVELGRKSIPDDLLQAISKAYQLDTKAKKELENAATESATVIKLRPTQETRTLVAQFARRFQELDKAEIDNILKVLSSSEKGGKSL